MIGAGVPLAVAIGAALWAQIPDSVASSTVATSSAAEEMPPLDDVPLSEEDLALIERLGNAKSSTVEVPIVPERRTGAVGMGAELAQSIDRDALRNTIPRSIAEALEAEPVLMATRRSYLPGDRPVIRGRTGARVGLVIDGLSLHHPLSSVVEDGVLGTIDPWLIEEVIVRSGGTLVDSGDRSAGALHLRTRAPSVQRHISTDAQVELRSSDRSSAAHVALEGGAGFAGLRAGASYMDFGHPRFSEGASTEGAHQRASASVRSQILGREEDLVRATLGFDFDRLTNVRRLDLTPRLLDRLRTRQLAFGQVTVGAADRSIALLVGHHWHRLERTPFGDRTIASRENADQTEARLDARWSFDDRLRAIAGAEVTIGDAEIGPGDALRSGSTGGKGAYAGLVFELGWLSAAATARFVDATTELEGTSAIDGRGLLTEGRAELELADGFSLGAGWFQGLRVPTVKDRTLLETPEVEPKAERVISADFGPILRLEPLTLSVLGFASWSDHSLEIAPSGLGLVEVDALRIYGLEGRGDWTISRRVSLALAFTWSGGRVAGSNEPVNDQPGILAHARLRYELGARGAFLEASSWMCLPTEARSAADRVRFPDAGVFRAVVFGARGGAELGQGFRLTMSVENVLDASYRTFGSSTSATGVDLRIALAHEFE
jgi:outer membrane receptor protein involved in Fe transport